jgi:hypothetical protein
MSAINPTETTELEPTTHAARDEYYVAADDTCRCGHPHPHAVGRNASKGQRKLDHLCDDCLGEMEKAPKGLYDPVLIATNPKHE